MTYKTLFGIDAGLSQWVSNGVFGIPDAFDATTKAIGLLKNDNLIAATIYHNYHDDIYGNPHSIEMGIYTIDKTWATKAYLRSIFSYPFIQLRLKRVQIITSTKNEGVNSLVSRLGYTKEGEHRKAYPDCSDAYSWGMLREDCRWIDA